MGQLSQREQIDQFVHGLMLAYKHTHEISENVDTFLKTWIWNIWNTMHDRVSNIGEDKSNITAIVEEIIW